MASVPFRIAKSPPDFVLRNLSGTPLPPVISS